MIVSAERYAQILEFAIALERAIEYHCSGHYIPLEISVLCPHHSAILNSRLDQIINERVSLTNKQESPEGATK